MSKWLYFVPVLLVFIPIVMIAGLWYKDYQWRLETYGPDPAYVDFETNWGSGYMMVRDVKNAESEVKMHMEETLAYLRSTPKLEIRGVESPVQIKKITVRNVNCPRP